MSLSYLPRPDGKVLSDSPDMLIENNKYAKVPFIVGDQEDEGTLFGLFTANLTTTAQVSEYLNTIFFPDTDRSVLDGLVATYQTISEDGSPFRTAFLNNWYPQFKRVSAMIGDFTFTLTRRVFLDIATRVNPGVKSWSYLSTYNYGTPILGTFHGSDLLQVFYGILPNNAARTIRGYYFSFIYDLDPNSNNDFADWPQWSEGRKLIEFRANSNSFLDDNFRTDSYEFIRDNVHDFRI